MHNSTVHIALPTAWSASYDDAHMTRPEAMKSYQLVSECKKSI